jgi:hypothetical protein
MSRINKALATALQDISHHLTSKSGNEFDSYGLNVLHTHLSPEGVKLIPNSTWLNHPTFSQHRERVGKFNFDFSDIPTPDIGNGPITSFIVDQPNNSQKWPDCLFSNNGIGLPIEWKSGQVKPTWNGGKARYNGIYVYNDHKKQRITFCLGQHLISPAEEQELNIESAIYKSIQRAIIPIFQNRTNWSLYIRDMFNSKQDIFKNSAHQEAETLEFVNGLTWDVNSYTDYSKVSSTISPEVSYKTTDDEVIITTRLKLVDLQRAYS